MADDRGGALINLWANRSLRVKGLVVVLIPLLALIASVGLINQLNRQKNEAKELVNHTQELRAQLQNMFIVLISAESEVRNYGLNGREEGILPFAMSEASIDAVFTKTKELMQSNTDEVARVSRLKEFVHQRLGGLKELRTYYSAPEARGTPPPPEIVSRARISPDVILAINDLAKEESRLYQERSKKSADHEARVQLAIYVSVGIGLLGGVLAALLFTKGLARRVYQLERSAARLEEGLAPEFVVSGRDELGRLAGAMERAGRILAAQSEELKLALEGGEVLIWELEPESGRIRYPHGSGALESASFPPELLPDSVDKWVSILSPENRNQVRQELNRIDTEGGSFQIEYPVVVRGGETRWTLVKAQSHGTGTKTGRRLLGVLANISARKSASEKIQRQAQALVESKEALQDQTRILQSILDSMADGVVVTGTTGNFLVFNPAAQQILGSRSLAGDPHGWAQRHGLFQPDMISLYPSDDLPFQRAMRGESVDGTEIFVRPAGAAEGRWVSVSARPLRGDDGSIRGGVVVIRDVTEPKRAAEALKIAKLEAENANQAKSEFLSRMSHELRTPLNSILGFAQLLELSAMDDRQTDNVRHILKGGYHLLDLINEILDLARIDSGHFTLSPEPVRMREVLKDTLDLVRPLAAGQNINLDSEYAIPCDRYVQADRQRLKQVLLNILSNAIKFNRKGGSVIVSCIERPDNRLRIEVADSGSGISADGLNKMFTPFERLNADQTAVGGTGLGLALSKRLVEAMGGTIGVESTVGLGSKFFIELALLEDPEESQDNNSAVLEIPDRDSASSRGTVLYIEDNESNLRLIERIMIHCPGVRLITAMHGQLGLELAELHTPDWILLDLHLPDLQGDEVLRRLRQNPRTRNIPVTVISADATRGQISKLLAMGARDYLTKPVDVRQLLQLLETTLHAGDSAAESESLHAERDHSK